MRIFSSKRSKIIALALTAGLFLIPAVHVVAGWGPSRPTFTWNHPATYVTFNSITDNPTYGDERPFFDGVDPAEPNKAQDKLTVSDNQELSLRVYFHNNAASNLNKVAHNTRVAMVLPTQEATASHAAAYIIADNASPVAVADTVDFVGAHPFTVEYVPGSARLKTNALNNVALSDNVMTINGTQVGYDKIDGNVPGCNQYSGWVTVKVKVHMKTPVKPVAKCEVLNVEVGDNRKVNASVKYTATGGATFKNVAFDWGDGNGTVTDQTSASYQYAVDGNYNISATLTFDVNGADETSTCEQSVSFSTTTKEVKHVKEVTKVTTLPNTGAGGAIGLFAGASSLAGLGHYVVGRRRG